MMLFSMPESLFVLLLPVLISIIQFWLWLIRIAVSVEKDHLARDYQCIEVRQRSLIRDLFNLCDLKGLINYLSLLFFAFNWVFLLRYFQVTFSLVDLYFLSLLLALMIFDFRYYLLPDPAVYLLLWGGVVLSLLGETSQLLSSSVLGVIITYSVMLLLYFFGWWRYQKEVLGRGDLKFSAAIGAWLGVDNVLCFLFIAAVIGIVWALIMPWNSQYEEEEIIPFGPSLGISGIILYFIAKLMIVF